jgi:glucosamine-6-phosphate deaminase
MGVCAAQIVEQELKRISAHRDFVLGTATGGTPESTYSELVRLHLVEGLDFSRVIGFGLDEYVGLSPDHPQSYHYFMADRLWNHVNIPQNSWHLPSPWGLNDAWIKRMCLEYERRILSSGGGKIDLQLLGIGSNGHIAFNEPGSLRKSRTRIVELTEQTIRDNARFFDSTEEVPTRAVSMGIGTILELSAKALLLANGAKKAEAIRRAFFAPVSPNCPASFLQEHPGEVIVVLDEEAAALIRDESVLRRYDSSAAV